MNNHLIKLGRFIKSILDRFVAFIAIIFLFPILIIVAGAIYLRMGSPVLFIQPRPGKNARIFNFYKF
jgi:lipopolysaccharide/colanic/teichoic acid biosynthesis glycosyltransferase